MEQIKSEKITKVFEKKIWIESDILGSKHIMMQHDDGESDQFTYCTFYYDYRYTCNSFIHDAAEQMALSLGATKPIENRMRELKFEST